MDVGDTGETKLPETNPPETKLPETNAPPSSDEGASAPSGLRLALASLGVFLALIVLGGAIGLVVSQPPVSSSATAAVGLVERQAPSSVEVSQAPVTTTIAPAPPGAPSTAVNSLTTEQTPIPPEVLAATEQPVEKPQVLEIPKAVYDRFVLDFDDSVTVNITENDNVSGELESVELTGLGELAPGFLLLPDGTLSGRATECGSWQAQYQLKSTNPARTTSWVDITVNGCLTT